MVKQTKKKLRGGQETPVLTKEEVLSDPKIKEALKAWSIQQGGGMKMRMTGSGWWGDFVGWLKKNKVISIASKIGSAVANATGFVPLGVALGGVATASSALGYGRAKISRPRMMMGGQYAQSIALPSTSTPTPQIYRF
jgi:hypothetical protein